MDVCKDFAGLKQQYKNVALGLGNFDGVHRGHQKLIHRLVTESREKGCVSGIFTFDPHPLSVLQPEQCPPFLLPQKAKLEILERLGVELVIALPFNYEFAQLTPYDFVNEVLCRELQVRSVVVGYNFTFGHRGRGTPETLAKYSGICGYEVSVIPPVMINDTVVSSTLVRSLLLEGRVEEAEQFLGYSPFVDGMVIRGDRRGSTIGIPTANLTVKSDLVVPARGVYAVKVEALGEYYGGVANIGLCPTFKENNTEANIEVHILDFSRDLYGQEIRVHFTNRLRDECKFSSVHELLAQINRDIEAARGCFAEGGQNVGLVP
ncbi:MAG: bifunctional riboflavin kinase/FAD synthetase [Clostridia bacterium]|nr:bifunctional riboflavin kinase/FAD synthetase [Clostridia bacterium]